MDTNTIISQIHKLIDSSNIQVRADKIKELSTTIDICKAWLDDQVEKKDKK